MVGHVNTSSALSRAPPDTLVPLLTAAGPVALPAVLRLAARYLPLVVMAVIAAMFFFGRSVAPDLLELVGFERARLTGDQLHGQVGQFFRRLQRRYVSKYSAGSLSSLA